MTDHRFGSTPRPVSLGTARSNDKRYRVAQWVTGHTGAHVMRRVIEHPRYDLVGGYVYSDEKAGRDAGELCGTAPTGVRATRIIDDILAAEPDCVLYMPVLAALSIDEICRLLESGANVITSATEFHHPAGLDPDVRGRIEMANASTDPATAAQE